MATQRNFHSPSSPFGEYFPPTRAPLHHTVVGDSVLFTTNHQGFAIDSRAPRQSVYSDTAYGVGRSASYPIPQYQMEFQHYSTHSICPEYSHPPLYTQQVQYGHGSEFLSLPSQSAPSPQHMKSSPAHTLLSPAAVGERYITQVAEYPPMTYFSGTIPPAFVQAPHSLYSLQEDLKGPAQPFAGDFLDHSAPAYPFKSHAYPFDYSLHPSPQKEDCPMLVKSFSAHATPVHVVPTTPKSEQGTVIRSTSEEDTTPSFLSSSKSRTIQVSSLGLSPAYHPYVVNSTTPSKKKAPTKRPNCLYPDCTRSAQSGGLCRPHGGGSRCKKPSCTKYAQRGGFCSSHGGGRRCAVKGCPKGAQAGGRCVLHGGGKRCRDSDCSKLSQRGGYCSKHYREFVAMKA